MIYLMQHMSLEADFSINISNMRVKHFKMAIFSTVANTHSNTTNWTMTYIVVISMTYSIYEMKKKILPSYLKGFLKKKEEEWRFHIFFHFRDINVFF